MGKLEKILDPDRLDVFLKLACTLREKQRTVTAISCAMSIDQKLLDINNLTVFVHMTEQDPFRPKILLMNGRADERIDEWTRTEG